MAEGWPFLFFFFFARAVGSRGKSRKERAEKWRFLFHARAKGFSLSKIRKAVNYFEVETRLRLWDALVALMPWLGVIRGMKKGKYFGKGFGG